MDTGIKPKMRLSDWRAAENFEKEQAIARALRASRKLFDLKGKQCSAGAAEFIEVAFRKVSKLSRDQDATIEVLERLYRCPRVRGIHEWEPAGKARTTIRRNLIDHLVGKYPVPDFLYNAFESDKNRSRSAYFGIDDELLLFCYIAQGGSVSEAVKTGLLPVPLTKRMAHLFMQAPAGTRTITEAVRWAQVRAFGGTDGQADTLMGTFLRDLQSKSHESFWMTVIQWLCQNPMLGYSRIGPVLDYIRHRHAGDQTFSMKGRSALALLRETEQWHEELTRKKEAAGRYGAFKPSGFHGFREETKDGMVWEVVEILSGEALRKEGQALRHCVYSYAHDVNSGRTSIWSLRLVDQAGQSERCVTIEVHNKTRCIQQVRGFRNRMMDSQERNILWKWARGQGLVVTTHA